MQLVSLEVLPISSLFYLSDWHSYFYHLIWVVTKSSPDCVLLSFRNASSITLSKLHELSVDFSKSDPPPSMVKNEKSTSMELLLKFQRLLICFLFPFDTQRRKSACGQATSAGTLGAISLLKKYISLLSAHIHDVLPAASDLASRSPKQFSTVASIIESDLSGNKNSLIICIKLLKVRE